MGDTPTFETYRRDRLYSSIVDVTACSQSLLGRMANWGVDRGLITSDHNAITFELRLEKDLEPLRPITTRRYNTKKADWTEFKTQLNSLLAEKNITSEVIERETSPEGLEEKIIAYTNTIQEACEKTIPKIGAWKGKAKPPWWSNVLEEEKKDVLRKKRRIKNAAPHRKPAVIQEYNTAKQQYQENAEKAQTESWKEFCSTQEKESMWDGIYRVMRGTARRQEDTLLRNSTGETLSPVQSAELLAKTFYPEDSTTTDNPYHTEIRKKSQDETPEDTEGLSEEDPPFKEAELELVLRALNPKKAPGPDGLTSDICTAAIHSNREVFMAIANKCLSLAHLPKLWKTAHVVILRKPGKADYTQPKSYRPIGLLSVMGKIVEKLMVGRLQWHLLPTLSPKQYGFMPQKGTEDALYDLMKHIRSELKEKKIVVIVSLDIEGAFDNAWWPALKLQLKTRKCPKNLYAMVNSYLRDRKIVVNYARASSEKETTKGCVQGSIGGPTFWNIILDPLLQKLTGEGVYCQAFADDGVLVFTGHNTEHMQENINNTLKGIAEWGEDNKLKFAAHKTNAMLLTKKLKYEPLLLSMSGEEIKLVEEIKLLGLVIDSKLSFKPHVTATCKKAAEIYKQLSCAAKVTWGLNGEINRTIYVAVIEPIMLYAASAWSQATELQMIQKQLNSLQRGFAQKICKAYRTVSLTAALVLSGLLPLDLRIQEATSLYEAKKGLSRDYLPPGRELEQKVSYREQPHPATLTTTEYELLENMDPETQETHRIAGPQIYTDGSKIEGKTGAALTWWEGGKETMHSKFSLDPSCTVFQSELFALHKAVELITTSNKDKTNILSDSRSSLELLENPKPSHPLAKRIKEDISQIRSQGREVKLFWLRAHVGTVGNERADELAKQAALQVDPAPDYAEIPLSYVKKKIREESVRKWQDRYDSSITGLVTKTFLPDVNTAYSIVRKTRMTALRTQILTGHGGIAEYLHRFKLKDSPGCECDASVSESVWHIILQCPRFQAARWDLEQQLEISLKKETLSTMMTNNKSRQLFLQYAEQIMRTAAKRNSSTTTDPNTQQNIQTTQQQQQPAAQPNPVQPTTIARYNLLEQGESGTQGIRLRPVALYMDNNKERLGIAYCNARARKWVTISPGLALLLNGSNFKTSMKRRKYDELVTVNVANQRCKIVRIKNKIIALFETGDETPFAQACSVLETLKEGEGTPKIISVDAMVAGLEKGDAKDYLGILTASRNHEVVVYENRGDNLKFVLQRRTDSIAASTQRDHWDNPIVNPEGLSGSERLQNRTSQEKSESIQSRKIPDEPTTRTAAILQTIGSAATSISEIAWSKVRNIAKTGTVAKTVESLLKTPPKKKKKEELNPTPPTKAEKGEVSPPELRPVKEPKDHVINAFIEFIAITKATKQVNLDTCKTILKVYIKKDEGLLRVKLEKAEAAIYDNDTAQILGGKMSGQYMAAYNMTEGFVELDEDETKRTGKPTFNTPPEDPIVVTAKCTKIMLEDRILEMAQTIIKKPGEGEAFEHWTVPKITWVNGVPGCGKSTWVIKTFNTDTDLIITTTTQAAIDLREKISTKIGEAEAKIKIRTMASILVNGTKAQQKPCTRVMIDEALMNHFGAIVMAMNITGAKEVILIGDNNQLPYIDKNNLFKQLYTRPTLLSGVDVDLLCTHRNPMDVAYALREVYSGIYSSKLQTRSLRLERFTRVQIPKDQPNTLYLVHTQAEKELLISQGYGEGEDSRTLTIHEAQGLTFESVIVVRAVDKKLKLHQSVPHAVVAVSRHTQTCTYYTDCTEDDATATMIADAISASERRITEYNTKMAIRNKDTETTQKITQTNPNQN